jgi:dTDP-glucose 4,6-dehydratase
MDSSVKIDFRPLPQDDPKQRKPDITRAKNILDWEPKVSRKEGLRKTIEYFQNRSD